jgi:hypothetical protein
MSDTSDAMIAKVRKLLAMTTASGATEAEAANAASLVQTLLATHNLSMAQVEASTPASADNVKRAKTQADHAAMYRYQRDLMSALASNNFCKHFITEVHTESFGKVRKVKRHVILGRESNVQVTLLTYGYLVETMDRLLPYVGMQKRGKEALLWLEGCGDRLRVRLSAKRRQHEAASKAEAASHGPAQSSGGTPGTALTLVDVYASEESLNEDFHRGLPAGTTAAHRAMAEARQAARRATIAAANPGETEYVIQLMASGYSREEARKWDAHWDSEKHRKSQERRWKAETERKSHPAYRARWPAN